MSDVRQATPEDAESIREIARTSWHAAYDGLLGEETVERTIDEWYDPDGLREAIGRPEHVVHVVGNDPTGFVHVGPAPGDKHVAELFRIYVRPEQWGEGIGGRLLDSVEAEIEGYDRLTLSVFAENEVGIDFYENEGFERVGEETAEFDGDEYRAYRYEKGL
ncbi:GNAT family N-acetyltransferase [Halalkalicoccus ordinarius]|uniref:GNAT family N-acetyltransferase n=1 Tax=Halalkalicoccus ordinarius TaxID=3116651 RepID=UPI00300F566B